jgi:hypothetical protein
MPRHCSVCARPERGDIDTLIRNHSASLRSIGRQFGFSVQTALRHREHFDRPLARPRLARDPRLTVRAARQTKRQVRAREMFLRAYSESGCVTTAAQVAGISRGRVYQWQEEDDQFAVAFREAGVAATESLEQEAWRRAHDGVAEPVYQHGKQVGTIQRYSDQLLMFLLRARAPERYRDRVDVNVAPIIKAVAGFDPTEVL